MKAGYILPLRRNHSPVDSEFVSYLDGLSAWVDIVVVDGSPERIFQQHRNLLPVRVLHVPVAPELRTHNGKVGGVLTGLRHTPHERVIIADDDVRYERAALGTLVDLLDRHAVVRPQNYFDPLPWHARLDTARTLLNRVTGGDWPGTLGIRPSYLKASGGYDGNVLFENLELVRTITAAGGHEVVPLGLYVRRIPSTATHFLSQRVRQAYDEFARPVRMVLALATLPSLILAAACRRLRFVLVAALLSIGVAESGRRLEGGRAHFPAVCSALAPLWILERSITSWLALGLLLVRGGVPYRGTVIRRAATSNRTLRRRFRPIVQHVSATGVLG